MDTQDATMREIVEVIKEITDVTRRIRKTEYDMYRNDDRPCMPWRRCPLTGNLTETCREAPWSVMLGESLDGKPGVDTKRYLRNLAHDVNGVMCHPLTMGLVELRDLQTRLQALLNKLQ